MRKRKGEPMMRRLLAAILCIVLAAGNMSVTAYAAEDYEFSAAESIADEPLNDEIDAPDISGPAAGEADLRAADVPEETGDGYFAEAAEAVPEEVPDDAGEELAGTSDFMLPEEIWEQDAADGAFLIQDADDWEALSDYVENGGETINLVFRMTSDISTALMIGRKSNAFAGSFDGGGHTLTVDYADDGEEDEAPFRYADGATIENLRVEGQIATSRKYASGLIGHACNTVHITNVRVSAAITSTVSGTGSHGGFIGHADNPFYSYFRGCVFDGKMLGEETTSCGCFVGFYDGAYTNGVGGEIDLEKCLSAPSEMTVSGSLFCPEFGSSRYASTYYIGSYSYSDSRLKRLYGITGGEDVEVAAFGEGTSYDRVGVSFYDAAVEYDGRLYSWSGAAAKLDITSSGPEPWDGFLSSKGTLNPEDDHYALKMPGEDVAITGCRAYSISLETDHPEYISAPLKAFGGDAVSLTVSPEAGIWPVVIADGGDVELTDRGGFQYSFTMPEKDIVLNVEFRSVGEFHEEGGKKYLSIGSADEWEKLGEYMAAGGSTKNITFRMTDDIATSVMLGDANHVFMGTFDGGGHTLTVEYASNGVPYTAPFRYAENASFTDLHIAGTITTDQKFAAGLVGELTRNMSVTDVRSSVSIVSSVEGDGTHGGFVANARYNSNLTFTGCLFDGEMKGPNTEKCGGFVGWSDNSVTVIDSVFAPSLLNLNGAGQAVFFRNGTTKKVSNSYFVSDFGSINTGARKAYAVTAKDDVHINFGTVKKAYDVSGITFYGTGFMLGGVFMAAMGDSVAMDLTYTGEEIPAGFEASAGTLAEGDDGYILSMPGEAVEIGISESLVRYVVTVDGTAEHGTVTADTEMAAPGETVNLTVQPDDGYFTDYVRWNGRDILPEDGVYSFTMPGRDVTVTASFAAGGSCGKSGDEVWYRYKNGVLTVFGEGRMADYTYGSDAPWEAYKGDIRKVVICDGVTSIGGNAFDWCDGLEEAELAGSVGTIRTSAFWGCGALRKVTFAEGLTEIGNHAFEGCASLPSAELPDSLLKIGEDAFYACTGLAYLSIGSGDLEIGLCAFYGCVSLREVVIPQNVQMIDASAFRGCTGITDVWFLGEDFSEYGFEAESGPVNFNKTSGTTLHIPVDPESLTAETGNSIYVWYAYDPGSVVCDDLYEIYIEEMENGTVIADADRGLAGQKVTLTALPSGGYGTDGITVTYEDPEGGTETLEAAVTEEENGSCSFILPAASVTVVASFVETGYAVGLPAGLLHGEIIADQMSAPAGGTVRLAAVPEDGYALDYLVVLDADMNAVETEETHDGEYTFRMPECDVAVTAVFSECYPVIIGDIVGSGTVRSRVSSARTGENVMLFSEPEEGAALKSLVVRDGEGDEIEVLKGIGAAAYYFIMPSGSVTVTAEFGEEYHITIGKWIDNGTVYVNPKTAAEGETVTVTWTSQEPYQLYYLRLNGEDAAVSGSEYEFTMPGRDVEVTAAFVPGGSCGDNMTWQLVDGRLIVTGTGEMTSAPWRDYELASAVTSIELSNGITTIAPYAFSRAKVKSVVIPDSVVSFGRSVFSYCYTIEEITLSKNLEEIGIEAFYSCSALETVRMYDKVSAIGEGAFLRCDALKSITLSSGLKTLGKSAFESDTALRMVDLSGASVDIGERALWHCEALEEIRGAENVRSIGAFMCYYDTSLRSFDISDYVTEIGEYAFYYCTALLEVSFGSSLEKIGKWAFYECKSLQSVELPEGVTTVGEYGFGYCENLVSLVLPDSITDLGRMAFGALYAMEEIRIPGGVTALTDNEFGFCSSAKEVYIPAGVKTISKDTQRTDAFDHYSSAENVYFYGDDFTGYDFPTSVFNTSSHTVLHILYGIDPADLTAETGGAIYRWYKANPDSVINDIMYEGYYSVRVQKAKGGSVSVKPYVEHGADVRIGICPEAGYRLKSITANEGDVELRSMEDGSYSFVMPEQDVTLTPVFEVIEGYYEITDYTSGAGKVTSDRPVAREGDTVLLTAEVPSGCALEGVYANEGQIALTDNGDGTYSFTMPAENVTVTADIRATWSHEDDQGTTVWLIEDEGGWERLRDYIEDGRNTSGMTFRLAADIEVSFGIGSADHRFRGIFDGAGHTLTVDYADDGQETAAPFRCTDSATIKNLHTAGQIRAGGKFASGLVGRAYGMLYITNCRSSVTLSSSVSGDGSHGGFVGVGADNSSVVIKGCLFDGELLGEETTNCGGFIGWAAERYYSNCSATIRNSLFAPSRITFSEEGSANILRNPAYISISGCYYAEDFGQANTYTRRVYRITADRDIEISADTGEVSAEYDVSGLVFGERVILCGEAVFGIPNRNICMDIAYTGDSAGSTIVATAGKMTMTGGKYVLAMPKEDVRIALSSPVAVSESIEHGTVTADCDRAVSGEIVTLTVTPDPCYRLSNIYVNGAAADLTENEDGTCSFIMPVGRADVTAVFEPILDFETDGDERVWLIQSSDDWDTLADYTQEGYSTAGAKFRLTADITVTTMVADFAGTFDGDGHTLTLNYEGVGEALNAPFILADAAVFEHLRIAGTISSSQNVPMAGLIGQAQGATCITDCRSSVTVLVPAGNTRLNSGFVYSTAKNSEVCITGSVFDGIHDIDGYTAQRFAGFVGENQGSTTFADCLFNPSDYAGYILDSAEFTKGGTYNLVNCHYTFWIGSGREDDHTYKITCDPGTVLELDDGAVRAEYGTAGLAFYDNALTFDEEILCSYGRQVGLSLDVKEGTGAVFSADYGEIAEEDGKYVLTMPNVDVVISSGFPVTVDEVVGYGTLTPDRQIYKKGETVTLAVMPDEWYMTALIECNGEEIAPVNGKYQFTMPAEPVRVTARFARGRCGDTLYWDTDGYSLTIFGTGDMYDYIEDGQNPGWDGFRTDIHKIRIEDGATGIGACAFEYMSSLESIDIPESLTTIGARAFSRCISLTSFTIPAGIRTIDTNAFVECTGVTDVYIEGTEYGGFMFETRRTVDDFNYPSDTVLHVPCDVNPAELTEEKDASVFFWYNRNPDSVVNDMPDSREPAFRTHSLALGGKIGVNFFLELPVAEDFDYSESSVAFTVAGKDGTTTTVPYGEAVVSAESGYYGFTCCVSSIRMADEITAVFTYVKDGEEKTVEETYSVEQYIREYVQKAEEEPDKYGACLPLVKALADYAHFTQIYLAGSRGWVLGTDHAAMETFFTEDGFTEDDRAAALASLAGAGAVIVKNGDIAKISASLALDSDTAINLYIKRADSYKKAIAATADGETVSAVRQKDGRYKVTIANIGAHRLGEMHEVVITTSGDAEPATATLSVMSYVKACLGKENLSEDERNAMMALYAYYRAAETVING